MFILRAVKLFAIAIFVWATNGFHACDFWTTLFIGSGVHAGFGTVVIAHSGEAMHFGTNQLTLDQSMVDYVNDTE